MSRASVRIENLTIADFAANPYPIYAELRRTAPVAWIPCFNLWLVTRYDDVRRILLDEDGFCASGAGSLVSDTFGDQMLGADGEAHLRYRTPGVQSVFTPRSISTGLAARIESRAHRLIDGIVARGRGELRREFAARLPILVMLDLFGFPDSDEQALRAWYDSFEEALANHQGDPEIRGLAARNVAAFHYFFRERLTTALPSDSGSFMSGLVESYVCNGLDVDAASRNALVIFFGGVSTVEALILNTLWALFQDSVLMARVNAGRAPAPPALDETMRWLSPVQSAARRARFDSRFDGTLVPAGAVLGCMLGSANRDSAEFDEPDAFRLGRSNIGRHLGFAAGPHHCLGKHLARIEAAAALNALFERLLDLTLVDADAPSGHEFRQSRRLAVTWSLSS